MLVYSSPKATSAWQIPKKMTNQEDRLINHTSGTHTFTWAGLQRHEAQWYTAAWQNAPIFSTCAKRQYMAYIIGNNKRLISQGYNGSAPGTGHCNQGYCPRQQHGSPSGSIYDDCIAIHAEANALLWANPQARQNSTLILNGSPCYSCAKLAATSGITRIIGYSDPAYQMQPQVQQYLMNNNIQTILLNEKETRQILSTFHIDLP